MADKKISELTALTSPDGAEELIVNDGGTSKKITITNAIQSKAPLASPTFTGTVAIPNISNLETAVTANTAKTGITTSQANAITANTAKVSNATHTGDVTGATALTIANNAVTTGKIADDAVTADKLANSINTEISANTAKTSNATHTGEVTGATALTIANNVVDEANLKVSNSPTNGYFLSAQSGNTGGLTWAEVDALPSQSSNSGKFLTTNGSVASWAVVNALPTQTNNSGKFLTTNGTTASWTTISTGSVTGNGGWEHAHTISSNYTIASGNNFISAGAITINTGVSVTVPTGSTWVIA
tara:strand:+ start:611 stop:1516 length:906 start_codon:yes stop_codon:yes gene_type:complete